MVPEWHRRYRCVKSTVPGTRVGGDTGKLGSPSEKLRNRSAAPTAVTQDRVKRRQLDEKPEV